MESMTYERPSVAGRRQLLSPRLSEAFHPSENSLAFLRLFFAALVLLDHAVPLGGFNQDRNPIAGLTMNQTSLGTLAVAGFFVISGFLVTRSFVTSSTSLRYIWKRFLRIFPGFWVCLFVIVFAAAPIVYLQQQGNLHGYLQGHVDSPSSFVKANFWLGLPGVMSHWSIDGLLTKTPYRSTFDGSLWTLSYEFKCYLGVGLLGLFGLLRYGRYAVLALSTGLWTAELAQTLAPGSIGRLVPVLGDPQLIDLAFLFSLGTVLFLFREKIPMADWCAGLAVMAFVVSLRTSLYAEVGQIAFAYLCFWLAVRLPVRHADRYGDFSYGLYIYAFPVEQMASLYHLNRWGYVPYVAITMVVSIGVAIVSWHVVEQPAMKLKGFKLPMPSRDLLKSVRASVAVGLVAVVGLLVVASCGVTTTSSLASLKPATEVLRPSNGAKLSGKIILDASGVNTTSVTFRLFGGAYGYAAPVLCAATPTEVGWLCRWDSTSVPDGSYILLSEAKNAHGRTFSAQRRITVQNPPDT